ncbi:DMT family transporter [Rosettibacter firmus]|uniref:DMT family transporter n=1 Tax=Rosettibacter firmus TaxID=3111522 RepID=UPI00336BD410
MFSENLKIILGYILICLIWGSTWLAIRIGLDSLTPIFSAGIRFILASIYIYILMRIQHIKLQKDKLSLKLYFILAFFSFSIPFGLVYWAEQFIPSGLASILFATLPFGVIIFSFLAFPNYKISYHQLIGVILGFIGIIIIFSENLLIDIEGYFWGILAVLLSSFMQASIAVIIKKHGEHLNPLSMNFLPLLISGFIMILMGALLENSSTWKFDYKAIGSILFLSFFGTVITFTTYYWLLKRMNVVILSLSSFITPIVAVILGGLVLNEKLTEYTILGSSLVLIGILFANFRGLIKYFEAKKIL